MSMQPRRELRVLLPAAGVAFALQAAWFHGMRLDDAFITYRYGQNLAMGHGLTFNPGEPFLGSTSPGHMLLAALVYAMAGLTWTPSVLAALGCLGWALQSAAAYVLLREALGIAGAALVAVVVALGGAGSYHFVSLETNLLAALSLFALCAARAQRWRWAAVLSAAACLVRPDAALLALVLAVACVRQLRSKALGPAVWFVAITLPWMAFATSYYGSPLPHSAVAKLQRTELWPYLQHMLGLTAKTLLPLVEDPAAWLLTAAWLAVVAGAVTLLRRDVFLRIPLIVAVLHALAYLVMRPIAGHDWHLYPLMLVAVLFAVGGLARVVTATTARSLRVLGIVASGVFLVCCALRTAHAAREHVTGFWTGGRDRAYQEVAVYLQQHTQPTERFAAIEVGTLAYYSQVPAYDLGGLVTDLRSDAMATRNVRHLVFDEQYVKNAPPFPPVFHTERGGFSVFVYELPRAPSGR